MLIRFGLHRDGLDPTAPTSALGEVTLGPLGFIRLLETELGLPPVLAHPAEQLMAYRGCLSDANDLTRFYFRSFAIDPINVARTLLDWRAQWYAAGWNGTFAAGCSARLHDMAAVEQLTVDQVPLNAGQRLQRIAKTLRDRGTQIQTVQLLDDPASLPVTWRAVIERLPWEVGTGVIPSDVPNGPPDSDLRRVQAALLSVERTKVDQSSADSDRGREVLQGDGTLLVVRATSRDVSARAIAESLRAETDPTASVVLAERDGIILDNAFERSGMARCGFQHYSRFRAVSQVLKLGLALLWEPLSPHLLLQFLVHPLGPVDGRIRRALAEAVAAEPGVGGRAWEAAVSRLKAREDLTAEQVDVAVDYWFGAQRHPRPGAPLERMTERAQRCADWLATRLAVTEDPAEVALFRAAHSQAAALIDAFARLADLRQMEISKAELDRLLDEVTRQQPDPATLAEAGRVRGAVHPAAITDVFDQTLWWDMHSAATDSGYPWSRAELAELRGAGVELPTVESKLQLSSCEWRRPILNTRRRAVLVVHDAQSHGHPLLGQLASLMEGWAEVAADQVLMAGSHTLLPHLGVETVDVPIRPLPAPKRWWQLPVTASLQARDFESYSSLSKLFFYPHEWVLTYAAGIRKGRADDLAEGALLYGSLAHRLFEEFFGQQPDWYSMTPANVEAWLGTWLPRLIEREAAVLLESGRGVDRQQVTATLELALERLLGHLRAAGVSSVAVEQEQEQPFGDRHLRGAIDLLLTSSDGREIVVDAKWGGEGSRAKEIEANRHLQLATYAYMRKTARGANAWPYVSYFIIKTGNILAPDPTVFPDALVQPSSAAGLEELWSGAMASYQWRRDQLDAGQIEVNAAGTVPSEESQAPEDALDNDRDPDRFDEFTRLTGWGSFE